MVMNKYNMFDKRRSLLSRLLVEMGGTDTTTNHSLEH